MFVPVSYNMLIRFLTLCFGLTLHLTRYKAMKLKWVKRRVIGISTTRYKAMKLKWVKRRVIGISTNDTLFFIRIFQFISQLSWRHHFHSFTVATITWLTVTKYLFHKWPRICSTFHKHFPVLSSFMTCLRVYS
jgi:hypothetical protein